MTRPILLFLLCIVIIEKIQAQLPEVTSSDKLSPIKIKQLEIDVRILGNRSVTTYTISFHNPSDKILEATFLLALPEGANVSRYALDIDGKMREGVPVEKAKATEVFESIEKRKVDPGLIEKMEGNVFRTRIYPVPPNGERCIIIAFDQELQTNEKGELVYHLPITSKDTIRSFRLTSTVQSGNASPYINSTPTDGFSFIRQGDVFSAQQYKGDVLLSKPLTINIPIDIRKVNTYVQSIGGERQFYLQTSFPSPLKSKRLPKSIAIIWDISLSGLYRDKQNELLLLQEYLMRCGDVKVELFTLSNTFTRNGTFLINDGKSQLLIQHLRKMVYDGGTDYSKIKFAPVDETLLFSDGLSTLSDVISTSAPHIVYTFSSSPKADHNALRRIAEENGGSYINLIGASIPSALKRLTHQELNFLGLKKNYEVISHYPAAATPIQNSFSLAGSFKGQSTTLVLQFGYGKTPSIEKVVRIDNSTPSPEGWDIKKLIAQKQIAHLEKSFESNREEILQLGKKFSIVTHNTSLLVLENVADYVAHNIEPPAELSEEYKRLLKVKRDEITQSQKDVLENAVDASTELWDWWTTEFPIKEKPLKEVTPTIELDSRLITQQAPRNMTVARDKEEEDGVTVSRSVTSASVVIRGQSSMGYANSLEGKVSGLALQEVVVTAVGMRRNASLSTNNQLIIVDGKISATLPPKEKIVSMDILQPKAGVTLYGSRALNGVLIISTKEADTNDPEIALQEHTSSSEYLKALKNAPKAQQYYTYLQLRDKQLLNPTFYYEVAQLLLKTNKTLGLRVLSNLGELDYQNHELHKLFGFKLKELGEVQLAQYIFKKVLLWRPQEPQSFRDYALALADGGKYQAALDTLYLSLSKEYNPQVMENNEGIEETVVTEINNLITVHKLNTSSIDRKLFRNMPVDIRVVLNWNMNDTDMDLWVTDPKGEKCYYSNDQTNIGGRMSDDFTNGYGPEQFLLKKAIKGKYKIEVDYYGESGVKVAGKTTLHIEVFTNYGRTNQQRKQITLQLEEKDEKAIYVGEFIF